MSRVKVIILLIVMVLVTNVAQGFIWNKSKHQLEVKLKDEIAVLNSTLDALGPATTVYTVATDVEPGTEIKDTDLVEMTMPASLVMDNYVTNKNDVIGKEFKITLTSGTPLTTDLVMEYPIDATTRDFDIVMDRWTVGLKTGDYVDLRITLPYGEDYIVLSHCRVYSVGTSTLKMYLDESQWHIYQAALVDYYINVDKGASLYVSKYIEPGVQKEAEVYYSVPDNIKAIMIADPNIVDKAAATANSNMRKSIDSLLESIRDENSTTATDTGKLQGGRSEMNSKVNGDATVIGDISQDSGATEEDVLDDVFVDDSVITDEEVVE